MADTIYPMVKWDDRAERLATYQKWIDALHARREQERTEKQTWEWTSKGKGFDREQANQRYEQWKRNQSGVTPPPPSAAGQTMGGTPPPQAAPADFSPHGPPPLPGERKEDRAKTWKSSAPSGNFWSDFSHGMKMGLGQFGGSSGGSETGGNSDIKDLIEAIKELISELRDKKTDQQQPGIQPDGSFVPSLGPRQQSSPQQSAGPRPGANRGGTGGLHGTILRTVFGR